MLVRDVHKTPQHITVTSYSHINDTTYATTTTTNYKVVQQVVTSSGQSSGGWVYKKTQAFANAPADTATTQYRFSGANFSNCEETCTTLPTYYYEIWEWKGSGRAYWTRRLSLGTCP